MSDEKSKEPEQSPEDLPREERQSQSHAEAAGQEAGEPGEEEVAFWEEEQGEESAGSAQAAPNPQAGEPTGAPQAEPDRFSDIYSFLSEQYGPGREQPVSAAASGEGPVRDESEPEIEPEAEIEAGQGEPSADAEGVASEPSEGSETLSAVSESEPEAESQPEEEAFFGFPESAPFVPGEDTEEMLIAQARHRRRLRPLSLLFNLISWCVLVTFFLGVGMGLLYVRYAMSRLKGPQPDGDRVVYVRVEPGDRLNKIIERLRAERLVHSYLGIDDKYLMLYLAKVNGNSNLIKHGVYRLNSGMSLNEVYDRLVKGSKDFKVTIPEEKTLRDVASIVGKSVETFDEEKFVELCRDGAFIQKVFAELTHDPALMKDGETLPSLEGYLYPSTYYFGPGMKEEDLIRMMVKKFRDEVESKLQGVEKRDDLSFHEHLIMASLIDREARMDSERPVIASVIFNRMQKGMALEIDASVHYVLNDWSRSLTYEDLKIESPYNTYRNKGLPPGPICNPRISSILATFQPAETNYLFYVYRGDGTHAFARTFDEHKQNVKQYRKWRAEQIAQLLEKQQSSAAASGQTTATGGRAGSSVRTGKRSTVLTTTSVLLGPTSGSLGATLSSSATSETRAESVTTAAQEEKKASEPVTTSVKHANKEKSEEAAGAAKAKKEGPDDRAKGKGEEASGAKHDKNEQSAEEGKSKGEPTAGASKSRDEESAAGTTSTKSRSSGKSESSKSSSRRSSGKRSKK